MIPLTEEFLKYRKYLIGICVLLLLVYILYKLSYKVRTTDSIFNFENTFIKSIDKDQLDFCNSEKYKYSNLADFYVSSGYNPASVGFLKYDYISKDMIEKTITNGSRYIELEILNYEIKDNTVPIIGIGNDEGYLLNSQNIIDCKEVFDMLDKVAFSEKFIGNYNDPLFIFLNLKTQNNINTLNKLYDIIINNISNRLLDERYNYQNINIATTKMCNFTNKIVILSSDGYQNSNLEKIINLSTNSNYLRRLKWDELPHKEELLKEDDTPIVSLVSKKISFENNYLIINDSTNFLELGVTSNTVISISGSTNPKNNTKDNLLHISGVTKNTIILDKNIVFTDEEEGGNISIKVFSINFTLKNLDKQNKSSLTIVYTHRDFFNFNYDPVTAWNLGCHFVCMNFQKQDYNLKKYMKKFNKLSFSLKPTNLRNVVPPPVVLSMNQKFPKFISEDNMPIIQNFNKLYVNKFLTIYAFSNTNNIKSCCINKLDKNGNKLDNNIVCSDIKIKKECINKGGSGSNVCEYITDENKCNTNILNIVNNNNLPKLAPNDNINSNNNNSNIFTIEDRSNINYNTIAIKNNNKYLASNESCCYLSFKSKPNPTNVNYSDFIKYTSFYPIESLCKSNTTSFVQKINNKKYYLKFRNEFESDNKLYKTTTTQHNLIGIINNKYIYEPIATNGYKSIGHILVDEEIEQTKFVDITTEAPFNNTTTTTTTTATATANNEISPSKFSITKKPLEAYQDYNATDSEYSDTNSLNFNERELNQGSLLLKGAVSEPIDFSKIWSNDEFYLWEPIAADGYVSLGIIFTKGNNKPDKRNFCCVATVFLSETKYDDEHVFKYNETDDQSNQLTLWKSKSKSNNTYLKASLSSNKPSVFIHPVFDIVFKSNDNLDILYMGQLDPSETNTTCFKLSINANSSLKPAIIPPIKFKVDDDNKIKSHNGKCIGLKKSYWSSIFSNNSNSNSNLSLVDCKDDSYYPTNFTVNDEFIHLTEKMDYCVEKKDDKLIINKYDNNNVNQKFKYIENYIVNINDEYKCLDYNENELVFNKCNFTDTQKWNMNEHLLPSILNINDIVYYKQKIPRAKATFNPNFPNNTKVYNYLNEVIDEDNFHLYLKGKIIGSKENVWKVKLDNSLGNIEVNKNDKILIPYNFDNNNKIKKGTYILAHDGKLNKKNYSTNNIMWKARVTKVLENNKLEVLFSINSIEANENKFNMGRPRINEKKILDSNSVIVYQYGYSS